jgi:hypothetical protein
VPRLLRAYELTLSFRDTGGRLCGRGGAVAVASHGAGLFPRHLFEGHRAPSPALSGRMPAPPFR